MKFIKVFLIMILLNNCSLNKDSKYWTEQTVIITNDENKISAVLEKSLDKTEMTIDEYEIYIDEYSKKSKFPDVSK